MAGHHPSAPALRRELIGMRAAGLSFNAIAAALNRRALASTQGARWYGASIQRFLHGARARCGHRCTASCYRQERSCALAIGGSAR